MKIAYLTVLLSALGLTACSSLPPQTLTLTQQSDMWQHLEKFQQIAQQHQNNRAVGSEGGRWSAMYIRQYAKALGLNPQGMIFVNADHKIGQNIIVELVGQNKDQAIIVGAHYDSVTMGPGINDNASGVAVVMSVMEYYAKQQHQPPVSLYFAFWDSEEVDNAGSKHFVDQLTAQQLNGIRAYINVDRVGSKHPTALRIDADTAFINELKSTLKQQDSARQEDASVVATLNTIPTHSGDAKLQQLLSQYLESQNIAMRKEIATVRGSDHTAFMGKVPVASLMFFNQHLQEGILEFAPCDDQACDSLAQIDEQSLKIARDAVLQLITALEQ